VDDAASLSRSSAATPSSLNRFEQYVAHPRLPFIEPAMKRQFTGGAGFIGSTHRSCTSLRHRLSIVNFAKIDLPPQSPANLDSIADIALQLREGDICDTTALTGAIRGCYRRAFRGGIHVIAAATSACFIEPTKGTFILLQVRQTEHRALPAHFDDEVSCDIDPANSPMKTVQFTRAALFHRQSSYDVALKSYLPHILDSPAVTRLVVTIYVPLSVPRTVSAADDHQRASNNKAAADATVDGQRNADWRTSKQLQSVLAFSTRPAIGDVYNLGVDIFENLTIAASIAARIGKPKLVSHPNVKDPRPRRPLRR